MIVAISLLEHTFRLASFWPGSALVATGVGLCVIVVLAAFAASATGGNALAPIYGYAYTAPRSRLAHSLTLGLPLLATAISVQVLAGRLRSRCWLYVIGVLCATLLQPERAPRPGRAAPRLVASGRRARRLLRVRQPDVTDRAYL